MLVFFPLFSFLFFIFTFLFFVRCEHGPLGPRVLPRSGMKVLPPAPPGVGFLVALEGLGLRPS